MSVKVFENLLAKKEKNMAPEFMLEYICWSFKEPIPNSLSDLIKAIAAYHKEIGEPPLDQKLFTSLSALNQFDISYTYARSKPNLENGMIIWEDIPMIVRINGSKEYLTYADIFFQLHKAVHPYLKDQDHHYFEGLALLENSKEVAPVYELYLGS
jgi:hypothetical protein